MYMGIWTPSKKIKDLFPYAMPIALQPMLELFDQHNNKNHQPWRGPPDPRDPPGPGSLASDLTLGHWDAWNVPPHRSRFALASYDWGLICFDSDSLRNSMIYVYTVHISIHIVHIYIYIQFRNFFNMPITGSIRLSPQHAYVVPQIKRETGIVIHCWIRPVQEQALQVFENGAPVTKSLMLSYKEILAEDCWLDLQCWPKWMYRMHCQHLFHF